MKYFIVLFIACTLFPVTMQAQRGNVMGMYYADDTLDVKYTKDILQGKLWELNNSEDVEGYSCIEFKGDSLHQTYIIEGTKYVFPCVYYLSDSYQMDYDEKRENFNQAGKYIQVKYLYTNCDGTESIESQSFWIRKLTDDTLELVEWRYRKRIERYHAKPIQEQ